jgi:2,3-bisphosphoglycerate-independent phosphoglycerate mutase
MRFVVLLLGDSAGAPSRALDGRTPLGVARTPALDALAARGKVGRVRTIPPGFPASEEVATQTLLGVPPDAVAVGGGPFAVLGLGGEIEPGDVAYRLSLVTSLEGALVDTTAGGIGSPEAGLLLDALEEGLADRGVAFLRGRRHAHVLVARDRSEVLDLPAPRTIVGQALHEHLPGGEEGSWLRGILDRAAGILTEHEVNRIRLDLGENPADRLWPWSGGRPAMLPSVPERIGRASAALAGHPVVRGVAAAAGYVVPSTPPDPDAVLDLVRDHDVVVAHLGRPLPASDAGARVRAVETTDREVVGPLVRGLEQTGAHRILVVADRGSRPSEPADTVPFLLAGEGVSSVRRFPFDEVGAASSDLAVEEGYQLLDYFLRRPARP